MLTIDRKLDRLARQMRSMAANDMGDLSDDEAALFRDACDRIDALRSRRLQTPHVNA